MGPRSIDRGNSLSRKLSILSNLLPYLRTRGVASIGALSPKPTYRAQILDQPCTCRLRVFPKVGLRFPAIPFELHGLMICTNVHIINPLASSCSQRTEAPSFLILLCSGERPNLQPPPDMPRSTDLGQMLRNACRHSAPMRVNPNQPGDSGCGFPGTASNRDRRSRFPGRRAPGRWL